MRSQPGPSRDSTLADDWDQHWESFGDAARCNPANAYRERLILRLLDIRGQGEDTRILDIGSGQGELAFALSTRYPAAQVRGIEYSAQGVSRAELRAIALGTCATFGQRDLLADAELDDAQRNWATHAVCSEVLEHVDEPVLLLRNATNYLGPGCRVVITVPAGPMSSFDRHIGHRKHYNVEDLTYELSLAGFRVHHVTRAGFPFFNLYRLGVVAKGDRLISAGAEGDVEQSLTARLALRVFRFLFHANTRHSRWGWQLTAVAEPDSGA